MHTTPVSLLEQLRQPSHAAAWDRFVALYTPLLFYWARRLEPQESDAADLVQDVFTALVRELPTFTYQPAQRFRAWLWTITLNKARERRRRRAALPPEVNDTRLDQAETPSPVEEIDEAEYRTYLVDRALQLMQADFQPVTWKACWEYVVAGRPAAEVAAELGITVNAVHLAKSRVLRRLRQELAGLLD
jgi:RNA polymerase sigma-70 factor (ECF subfamily)